MTIWTWVLVGLCYLVLYAIFLRVRAWYERMEEKRGAESGSETDQLIESMGATIQLLHQQNTRLSQRLERRQLDQEYWW